MPDTKTSTAAAPLLEILEQADSELEGWTCPSTSGCCHFERTGREPYVTKAEWGLLERELARQGRRLSSLRSDGACPFLGDDERCLVYRARPLGCRTFYCGLAAGPRVQRARLQSLVREVEDASRSLTGEDEGRPLRSWWRESLAGGRRVSIRASLDRPGSRR